MKTWVISVGDLTQNGKTGVMKLLAYMNFAPVPKENLYHIDTINTAPWNSSRKTGYLLGVTAAFLSRLHHAQPQYNVEAMFNALKPSQESFDALLGDLRPMMDSEKALFHSKS